MKHRRGQPCFSASLDALLQALLDAILFNSRGFAQRSRKEAKTTNGRLHFAETLKFFYFLDAARQILCQLDMTLNNFGVTVDTHEFERHPEFQRIEPSRAHLPIPK